MKAPWFIELPQEIHPRPDPVWEPLRRQLRAWVNSDSESLKISLRADRLKPCSSSSEITKHCLCVQGNFLASFWPHEGISIVLLSGTGHSISWVRTRPVTGRVLKVTLWSHHPSCTSLLSHALGYIKGGPELMGGAGCWAHCLFGT